MDKFRGRPASCKHYKLPGRQMLQQSYRGHERDQRATRVARMGQCAQGLLGSFTHQIRVQVDREYRCRKLNSSQSSGSLFEILILNDVNFVNLRNSF